MLLLLYVALALAQPRTPATSCPPGYTLSSNCVVAETVDAASWEGKVRAWCKIDGNSFHPVVSLDYAQTTTNEAVRIIATLREMPTETSFEAPSRYGVFITRRTVPAPLSSQASVGAADAHQVCVATGAGFNSLVDSKRANLIAAEQSIQKNGFKTQAEIAPAFRCVADKGRDACNNAAVVRTLVAPSDFPGGPLPAEFSTGKYIRCSLNSFTIEAFNNGRLELVIRKMSFGRGPATGPLMHRTFISGELNIQRKTIEPRVHRVRSREVMHKSAKYGGAAMPYSLMTDADGGNIAFHQGATNVASHGCVHLEMKDAKSLFEWAGPKDPVAVQFLGPYPAIACQCPNGFSVETSKCK